MVSGSLLVFADEDLALRQEGVRWYLEIVGRGLVLVDPAGEIEKGPVARAVESAVPVARERFRTRFETVLRRASEVSANAHHDEVLRLDRAVLVARVVGRQLVLLALALGIGDLAVVFLDSLEHLRGSVNDPHRLAAPLDSHLFPGRELADVGFDRSTECLGAIRGKHGGSEGNGAGDGSRASGASARDDQRAATAVDARVICHGEILAGRNMSRSANYTESALAGQIFGANPLILYSNS